jgi:hypothetical protein
MPLTYAGPGYGFTGLSHGREGTCDACGEEVNIAEKSWYDQELGRLLHKECRDDLNASQT